MSELATTARPLATEADLLRMPNDGYKYELVDGEIRVSVPGGARHGQVGVTDVRELRPEDSLDGEDVVPGFKVALADLPHWICLRLGDPSRTTAFVDKGRERR